LYKDVDTWKIIPKERLEVLTGPGIKDYIALTSCDVLTKDCGGLSQPWYETSAMGEQACTVTLYEASFAEPRSFGIGDFWASSANITGYTSIRVEGDCMAELWENDIGASGWSAMFVTGSHKIPDKYHDAVLALRVFRSQAPLAVMGSTKQIQFENAALFKPVVASSESFAHIFGGISFLLTDGNVFNDPSSTAVTMKDSQLAWFEIDLEGDCSVIMLWFTVDGAGAKIKLQLRVSQQNKPDTAAIGSTLTKGKIRILCMAS
jgi:hypothetical protein